MHTEKSFRNLIQSNWNQIVFTIFWLIWNQTDSVRLVHGHFQTELKDGFPFYPFLDPSLIFTFTFYLLRFILPYFPSIYLLMLPSHFYLVVIEQQHARKSPLQQMHFSYTKLAIIGWLNDAIIQFYMMCIHTEKSFWNLIKSTWN